MTESPVAVDRPAYVDRSEAICSQAVSETRALSENLSQSLAQPSSTDDPIVGALIEPGIEVLSRERDRLHDIGPPPRSRDLEIYLGLFDPILELARQRAAIPRSQSEMVRSLELMISDLSDEQSSAARRFGLQSCAIGFTEALGGRE